MAGFLRLIATAQRKQPASSGNSEPKVTGAARAARKGNGVTFPQPRVEVRSASTLGIYIIRCSNSVGVAISEALTTARRASISIEVTPTANRNTYSVATFVGAATPGSVLRPQPWAMKSQLLQSCCRVLSGCQPITPPHRPRTPPHQPRTPPHQPRTPPCQPHTSPRQPRTPPR